MNNSERQSRPNSTENSQRSWIWFFIPVMGQLLIRGRYHQQMSDTWEPHTSLSALKFLVVNWKSIVLLFFWPILLLLEWLIWRRCSCKLSEREVWWRRNFSDQRDLAKEVHLLMGGMREKKAFDCNRHPLNSWFDYLVCDLNWDSLSFSLSDSATVKEKEYLGFWVQSIIYDCSLKNLRYWLFKV